MAKYDSRKVNALLTYSKRLNEKRGEMINWAISLENLLDSFIASHFCQEEKKRNNLLHLIVQDMNFEKKIKVFNYLLINHYKVIEKRFPNLPTDLDKIRVMRNRLAHRLLFTSLETADNNLKEKTIEFIEKDKSIKPVSEKEIQQAINLTTKYVVALMMLGRSSAT